MSLKEKFDLLEYLKLAIQDVNEKGKDLSKSIIVGELAFLKPAEQLWASLLIHHIDVERIVKVAPYKAQYQKIEHAPNVTFIRRLADKPGKVKITKGEVKSTDFFKMRNVVANQIHKQMIKDNFKPRNDRGELSGIAKGMAEVVLRNHLFVKGMCGTCDGLGKHEVYSNGEVAGYKFEVVGYKFCERCNNTGKISYTIKEKMTIAKLDVTKTSYCKYYKQYEDLGESIIAEYENAIRDHLSKALYKQEAIA